MSGSSKLQAPSSSSQLPAPSSQLELSALSSSSSSSLWTFRSVRFPRVCACSISLRTIEQKHPGATPQLVALFPPQKGKGNASAISWYHCLRRVLGWNLGAAAMLFQRIIQVFASSWEGKRLLCRTQV